MRILTAAYWLGTLADLGWTMVEAVVVFSIFHLLHWTMDPQYVLIYSIFSSYRVAREIR